MCGFVGIFRIKHETKEFSTKALKMYQKLCHHVADWNGIYVGGSAILAHERLSIVDLWSGGQPLYLLDKKQVLVRYANFAGYIYMTACMPTNRSPHVVLKDVRLS